MRDSSRRTRLAAQGGALALVALSAALGVTWFVVTRPTTSRQLPDVAREFALGARWADSLERSLARPGGPGATRGELVAALYLERLRLGVGSPFRLIDYALRDPYLSESHRRRLAEAVLARTSVGAAYATPSEALDLIGVRRSDAVGLAHRQFMEGVTEGAAAPRVAELALRLAYVAAGSAGIVSPRAAAVAIEGAAQARDRALAMRDVAALVGEARRRGLEPLDLVPLWRAARRFDVERPLLDPPSLAEERDAVAMVPALIARMESLTVRALPAATQRSLGVVAAASVADLVAQRAPPPQAPVTVTLGAYASFVVGQPRSAALRAARSRFVAGARHEEALVAEFARLRGVAGAASEPALAVLTAAVAMRTYAQERAWLPGDDGPSALDLQSRLGLASLTFDARVPGAWRPYYTRMLSEVVTDLQRVFPAADVRGLHVHFGDSPLGDRALALHDPAERRVYFPLATSAGAMGHELAHDLDWQAARRRYGTRGGYRTDRSARQQADEFSITARRLAVAARPRRESVASSVQADRPTEAFARGVDWFVAAALARQGRVNGYLSSVQDAAIVGYASASPPRHGIADAEATLDALREIAPADPASAAWFDSTQSYGRLRASDALRRAATTPILRFDLRSAPGPAVDAFTASTRLLRNAGVTRDAWRCLLEGSIDGRAEAQIAGDAMRVAAEARAKGVVRRWGNHARYLPGAAARWRALSGAPWQPALRDSVVRDLRDAILWRAARPDDGRLGVDLVERSQRRAAYEHCARSPRPLR